MLLINDEVDLHDVIPLKEDQQILELLSDIIW